MSERRAWDVQPNPRRKPAAADTAPKKAEPQRPAARRTVSDMRAPARHAAAQPAKSARPARQEPAPQAAPRTIRRTKAPLPSGTLKERRRRKRRASRYIALSVFILLLAGGIYACWLPEFRIQDVHAQGPGAQTAQAVVRMQTAGTYFHILPRDSVFFLPKEHIRGAILDAVPEASAVSITRTSFSSLEVGMTPRAVSFLWCGTGIDTPLPNGTCYKADIEGFIFAPEHPGGMEIPQNDAAGEAERADTTENDPETAEADADSEIDATAPSGEEVAESESPAEQADGSESQEPIRAASAEGPVHVFSPLDRELEAGASPIRAHIASPARIPDALRFVDAMRELGAPVRALAIRNDEADLWVNDSTRITYILGHEEDAALLAASALPTLALTDGNIQYVDLRFSGKAYVKRYGD